MKLTIKSGIRHNSQAISPVIATVLLLLVAIVGVATFLTWTQQYVSGVGVTAHEKNEENLVVDRLIGDSLFIRSVGQNNTIDSIRMNNRSCSLNETNLQEGLNELQVSCTPSIPTGEVEMVIVSDKGVSSFEQFIKP